MFNDSMHISEQNPMIITTEAGLENAMLRIFDRLGIKANVPAERVHDQNELPTRLARKYLQEEKGHRVMSDPAFNSLIRQYGITPVKRGKENWYQVKDLDKIPSRI